MPLERIYPDVWVELAKGVWLAEKGGSAEQVEQREAGLEGRAWPKVRLGLGKKAWSVER